MKTKYIRISGNKKQAKTTFEKGLFIPWTMENIKNAFSFGNGTIKDFKRYAADNAKNETCIDIDTLTYIDTGNPCDLDRKTINRIFSKYNVKEVTI